MNNSSYYVMLENALTPYYVMLEHALTSYYVMLEHALCAPPALLSIAIDDTYIGNKLGNKPCLILVTSRGLEPSLACKSPPPPSFELAARLTRTAPPLKGACYSWLPSRPSRRINTMALDWALSTRAWWQCSTDLMTPRKKVAARSSCRGACSLMTSSSVRPVHSSSTCGGERRGAGPVAMGIRSMIDDCVAADQ